MRDQEFDEILRAKLQGFSVEYDQEDWDLFDAEVNPPIDDILRRKLSLVSDREDNADWESFSQKLSEESSCSESELAPTAPIDVSLDETIKRKLLSIKVPYEPADWKLMAEKLYGSFDAGIAQKLMSLSVPFKLSDWYSMDSALNEPFDQTVKQKLGAYSTGKRSRKDWRIMVGHLQELFPQQAKVRRIRRYSSAAVITLLLLIGFSLDRYDRTPPPAVLAEESSNFDLPINQSPSSTQLANNVEAVVAEQYAQTNENIQAESNQESSNTLLIAEASPNNTLPSINTINTLGESTYSPTISIGENALSGSEKLQQLNPSTSLNGQGVEGISNDQLFASLRNRDQLVNALMPMDYQGVSLLEGFPGLDRARILSLPSRRLIPEIWVGGSFGLNSAKVELSDRGVPGFFTGGRIELAFNDHFSLVTGLLYANERFDHKSKIFREGEGYNVQSKGDLRFLEFPLLLKHTYASNNKLNLIMQIGIIPTLSLSERLESTDDSVLPRESLLVQDNEAPLVNSERNFRSQVANIYTGIGLQYEFSEDARFIIEPHIRAGLQRSQDIGLLENNSEGKRLYVPGINFSYIYRIGKTKK